MGASSARDPRAASSPASASTAGQMPWASSRSSAEGPVDLRHGRVQGRAALRRYSPARGGLRQAQLVGHREQALLGAIVEVPLQPAARRVPGRHDPFAGCLSSRTCARSSAASRSLSTARRAAAPTSRDSRSGSRSAACSTSATSTPARSMGVTARPARGARWRGDQAAPGRPRTHAAALDRVGDAHGRVAQDRGQRLSQRPEPGAGVQQLDQASDARRPASLADR